MRKVISSHLFDAAQPPADHRPGKRAPTERRASTATRLDAEALYTSFGRDCAHLGSLVPSRLGLHLHMDRGRLDQSQEREAHRREGIPSCSLLFYQGVANNSFFYRAGFGRGRPNSSGAAQHQRLGGLPESLWYIASASYRASHYRRLLTHRIDFAGNILAPEGAQAETHPSGMQTSPSAVEYPSLMVSYSHIPN